MIAETALSIAWGGRLSSFNPTHPKMIAETLQAEILLYTDLRE